MRVLAYVYPGWHPIAERDRAFYPGFTEWDLVATSGPRFPGHRQPRLPLWGRYDGRDPEAMTRRIEACGTHGVDGLVYGFFWCRGKRVFQEALDEGYLGSEVGRHFPFALMWANRMPRRVLPVTRREAPVLDPERLVYSDVGDFVELLRYVAERYFVLDNYLRVRKRAFFSIFDTTFFVRELGFDGAQEAIARAREMLRAKGLPPLYLTAIDPQPEIISGLTELGFDAVTHYVLLPDWKGEFTQDYAERAITSATRWPEFGAQSRLPYHPSVSPGWDASPRGADFGRERPRKYPWWPVVTGEHPREFEGAVRRAAEFVNDGDLPEDQRLVFVASLNEWSEGHYLEPDKRFGMGWLEALRDGRKLHP
jgi:hypothetical protein